MKKIYTYFGLLGLVILASCASKPYEIKRSIEIETPAAPIYQVVNNHQNRGSWSPWEMKDPSMKKEFTGPESGVGAIVSWTSENEEVGTGSLEIVECMENSYIKNNLVFTAPFEANDIVEWWFEEVDGKTQVTWSSKGELPGIAAMFMDQTMDEMMGPEFEKGLSSLKLYCEENYEAPVIEAPVLDYTAEEIEEEEVDNM